MRAITFFLVFIILIATNQVFAKKLTIRAQETMVDSTFHDCIHKKTIIISTIFAHFSPTSNENGLEYTTGLISPGLEIKFCYALNNSLNLSTGLNYQHNKINFPYNDSSIKNTTNEITIPFLITLNLFQNKMTGIQLSSGCYFGQYLSIIDHKREPKEYKKNYAKLFSKDDFISDIYFAIGKITIYKKIPVGVDVFFRYRLREHTFVNFYTNRAFYGITLKYAINL